MSDAMTKIPPEFEGLSTEERIRRVQQLWDFIAQSPSDVPLPESHKRILDERLAQFEGEGSDTKPWSEVREELLKGLRRD